ncbi:peptidase inhibitor family I36 protein [Streptomyces jumonjinensis]|uniref:peptidase inhibitor family I36 protein n=1 Tax=Streptomyces jumonjinensis TaxID=1945 RepID=UPI0033271BE9
MRRIALFTAALTLAAGLAAAPAVAGPAVPEAAVKAASVTHFSGSDCPADSLCLYRDYNYSGGGIALSPNTYAGWLGDYGFNDTMSSWSNDTGQTCVWWSDAYQGGDAHAMYDRYRVNVLAYENDTASSVECW